MEKKDQNPKINVLHQIYRIYDDFADRLEVACKRACSMCCTCNVALTTIEGIAIYQYLKSNNRIDLMLPVEAALSGKYFQPEITINRLAERCRRGEEIPDAEIDANWGECPLLIENECPIYPVRPLGCRCLLSTTECRRTGCAQIDDFAISVSQVFFQVIENIDASGYSGNLIDILTWIDTGGYAADDGTDPLDINPYGLVRNSAMTVLMIPPEHRARMAPILKKLKNIQI